jgi:SAM-dependent methyltransferase
MQKDKTLQFWDDFYRSEQSKVESDAVTITDDTDRCIKEWIVQPSDELFRLILGDLFTRCQDNSACDTAEYDDSRKRCYRVLEIGCGTSLLSDSLCKYWDHHVTEKTKELYVVATDVSPVCIEQQIALQKQQKQLLQREESKYECITDERLSRTQLEYKVLNITESRPELASQFDMILDKGCLDTCLFRSKNTESWIDIVLHNIHSWLKSPDGLYTIITPRSKIKHVRDYVGFHVTRRILNESQFGAGELEPRSGSTATNHAKDSISNTVEAVKESCQYMYSCRRVLVSIDVQSKHGTMSDALMQQKCSTCGVTYDSFCTTKGSKVCSSDTKYWNRRWQGHLQHCKISTAGM